MVKYTYEVTIVYVNIRKKGVKGKEESEESEHW